MSEIKLYDVLISYPIKVGAESKEHVKEILMANELLRNAADLTLKITETKDEQTWINYSWRYMWRWSFSS